MGVMDFRGHQKFAGETLTNKGICPTAEQLQDATYMGFSICGI